MSNWVINKKSYLLGPGTVQVTFRIKAAQKLTISKILSASATNQHYKNWPLFWASNALVFFLCSDMVEDAFVFVSLLNDVLYGTPPITTTLFSFCRYTK